VNISVEMMVPEPPEVGDRINIFVPGPRNFPGKDLVQSDVGRFDFRFLDIWAIFLLQARNLCTLLGVKMDR